MSVLVKGMEMPKNCIDCAFGWNGWCHRINSRAFVEVDMRRHDCPLISVPPHGRLIDADAFERLECDICDGACESLPCDCTNCNSEYRCDFMLDIHSMPTIIPADGGET